MMHKEKLYMKTASKTWFNHHFLFIDVVFVDDSRNTSMHV